jgi:hypothetical protein
LLRAMGMLAGCVMTTRLDTQLAPDVVLTDLRHRRLFVGDAKATETAGCAATSRRLRRYVRATTAWRSSRYVVRVAICTAPSHEWRAALLAAVRDAGLVAMATGAIEIAGVDQVSWVDLGGATDAPESGVA